MWEYAIVYPYLGKMVRDMDNKWKSQIDERAYEALMNYTVDIDD